MIIMARQKRVNYLNNKDMLKEIHASKTSFSEFTDGISTHPDFIIDNRTTVIDEIRDGNYDVKTDAELLELFTNASTIDEARQAQAKRIQVGNHTAAQLAEPDKKFKAAEFAVDPSTILEDDLVFRVLTFTHIPEMLERKKTHKTVADRHIKLNFIPYRHYVLRDGKLVEVGKSHWKDGEFSLTGGQITNTLAKMFMLLVNRYSERSNWRGYTYIDEMRGQALLQLSHMGLQFEVSRSNNPFAYFTAVLTNSFTRVLNTEKNNQNLRDNLLESFGQMPSFTRQLKYEEEARLSREAAQNDLN